ncbi:DNA repair protein RecO [Candidatus Uhrbacteria bacterium]|nr:DNA repair protein RecO [Candidatus Uhrbacteria bacterium]
MSVVFQTRGIPLRQKHWREVDRLYTILTKEEGKVQVVGRGGNKPLAKLSPHLEFVCEADLMIVRGRSMYTLAGVERWHTFPNLYQDHRRSVLAQSALHLIDIGTREAEPDPVLYYELKKFLIFVDASPPLTAERSGYLLASFALKLLAMSGYRPELFFCLQCKDPIASKTFRWHALKGGVVCDPCSIADQETWFAARPMEDRIAKLLRFALGETFENQLRPHLPGESLGQFHEAVESLIVSHFPTVPLNSMREACLKD